MKINREEFKEAFRLAQAISTERLEREADRFDVQENIGFDIVQEELPADKKKVGRTSRGGKYAGGRIRYGYAMRRAAVVAILILGLFAGHEVSARMFGFAPWKFETSFLDDSKMDVKTYIEPAEGFDNPNDTGFAAVTRDVPARIPKGFKQIVRNQQHANICVQWNDGARAYLQYFRANLTDGLSVMSDGEYESKEKVSIVDFVGEYCVKGDEAWLAWDDVDYYHMILATEVEDSKKVLIENAESLYQ